VLPAWVSGQQSNDGGMAPLAAASLHGWVNLTNISSRSCTLEGAPAVTLMSRGIAVNVSYGQYGANVATKAGLPPHGTANFSIYWAAPYCPGGMVGPFPGPPDRGPFSLRATVDGVTLHVAIHSTASPGCVDHPAGDTSSVAAGPIEPGAVIPGAPPSGESSPLRLLRATAHDCPSHIAPGQVLKFVIALANPRQHAGFPGRDAAAGLRGRSLLPGHLDRARNQLLPGLLAEQPGAASYPRARQRTVRHGTRDTRQRLRYHPADHHLAFPHLHPAGNIRRLHHHADQLTP